MKKRWRDTHVKPDRQGEALARANARMRVINRDYDAAARAEMKREGILERLSCRGSGCYGCCHLFIAGVTLVEALHIVLTYPEVVARAESQLKAQLDRMNEIGMRSVDFMDEGSVERFEVKWFAEAQLCALLDLASGRCGVYDARPIACRQHHVLDIDPALCDPPGYVGVVPGYTPTVMQDAVQRMIRLMGDLFKGDLVLGPFQAQLLSALRMARQAGLVG
jgi:Fe-S-cluster containining protein